MSNGNEGYFDSEAWRRIGNFYKWATNQAGKADLARLLPPEAQKQAQIYKESDLTPGKVIPKVAIEGTKAAARSPVLGPALVTIGKTGLSAAEMFYAGYHNAIERPIAISGAITGDIRRGKLGLNQESVQRVGDIIKATEGVPYGETRPLSMGQAIDYGFSALGSPVPLGLTNPLFLMTPVADDPDFDITNKEDRTEMYFNNFGKSLTTGITDTALQLLIGGKGVGSATKYGWQAVGRVRPVNPKTMGLLEKEAGDFLSQAETAKVMVPYKVGKQEVMRETIPANFRPTSGLGENLKEIFSPRVLNDQGVPDPSKLRAVPIIGRLVTEPYTYRPATVVAELMQQPNAIAKVTAYLMTEAGSPTAFRVLEDVAPSIADKMKLSASNLNVKPLSNDEILLGPERLIRTPEEISYFSNVFLDAAQSPYVGEKLLEIARAGYSPGLLSWMPSGWKWIERANIYASRFKDAARYAEPKPFQNINVGGDIVRPMTVVSLTRKLENNATRLFSSLWQDQPKFILNATGDRQYQDIAELSAGMSKSKALREDPQIIRDFVNKYMQVGPDETMRLSTAKAIREESLVTMITRISPPDTKQSEIKNMVRRALEELENVENTIRTNPEIGRYGITPVFLEEGSGRVVFVDSMTKGSLKNSIIMPDYGAIERAVRYYWDKQAALGNFGASLQGAYEALHQFFSAAVLLRIGYTFKNAIVEPDLRWFSFTGAIYSSEVLMKGIKNAAMNTMKIERNPETGKLTFTSNVSERAKVAFSEYTLTGKKKSNVTRQRIEELQGELFDLGKDRANTENILKTYKNQLKKSKKKKDDFVKIGDTGMVVPVQVVEDAIETAKLEAKALDLRIKTIQEEISIISGTLPASQLARLKAKRLSQFEDEVQFNGYSIDAAFSPKWSGSAWKTNISPKETIFDSVIQARFGKKAAELADVPLRPTDPSYPGAMAIFMNQNLQDKSFRMILAGESDEAVAEYLVRNLNQFGEASEVSRIATDFTLRKGEFEDLKKYLEDPDFIAQIIKTQREVADDFFPDQNFRDFALSTNRMTDKIIRERFGAALKVGTWPDGREMPVLNGPNYLERQWAGIKNLGIMRRAYLALNEGFRKLFVGLSIPEYDWFRVPFYSLKFNEAMKIQMNMAKTIGRDGVEYVKDNPMWRGRAHQYALKAIDDIFYSIPRMNNFQYGLRFLATFPIPVLNSAKFYSRAILNNPYNLIAMYKVAMFPYSIAERFDQTVVDDEGNVVDRKDAFKNPKEQFVYWPIKDKYAAFKPKIPVSQFMFPFDGLTPSFLTKIPVSLLVTARPQLADELKEIIGPRLYDRVLFGGNPVGNYEVTDSEDNPFNSIYNTVFNTLKTVFLPPTMKNVFDYLQLFGRQVFSDTEDLAEYTTVSGQTETVWNFYVQSLREWDEKYIAGTATEEDMPRYEDAVNQAKDFYISEAARKFLSSLGVVMEPASIGVRKFYSDRINHYKTPAGRDELAPGLSANQAALKDVIGLYGRFAVLFLAPKRENLLRGTPSQRAIEKAEILKPVFSKQVGLNSENIDLFNIFGMPLTIEEYDPAARAFLYSETIEGIPVIGRKFTPQERESRAKEMLAYYEADSVWLMLQSALITRRYKTLEAKANQSLEDEYDRRMDEIFQKYEDIGFEDKYKDANGTRFNRTYTALKAVTEYKGKAWTDYLESNPDEKSLWATTAQWIEDRELFMEAMEGAKSTREKQYYSSIYRDRTYGYIRGNTYFADLYGTHLTSDPYFDRAYLVRRQLGETPEEVAVEPTTQPESSILDDIKLEPSPGVQLQMN